MGSVRRSSWKPYLVYLALNVVVSAVTILLVLTIWEGRNRLPAAASTSTLDVVARVASAIPPPTETPTPSPTPVTYIVKTGDTLNAIAEGLGVSVEALMEANDLDDPNSLDVGQVLIVPELEGPEGTPITRTPPPSTVKASGTPSPAADAPRVVVRGAYEQGDLESEYVNLVNNGGVASMKNWTLEDGKGNVYLFPDFTLYNGGGVNVYTRVGNDSIINLYWGLDKAIWGPGMVITLRDDTGDIHSTFQIPGG